MRPVDTRNGIRETGGKYAPKQLVASFVACVGWYSHHELYRDPRLLEIGNEYMQEGLAEVKMIKTIAEMERWFSIYGFESFGAYHQFIERYPVEVENYFGLQSYELDPLPATCGGHKVFVAVPIVGKPSLDVRCVDVWLGEDGREYVMFSDVIYNNWLDERKLHD